MRLKDLREDADLTQVQIAKFLNCGKIHIINMKQVKDKYL